MITIFAEDAEVHSEEFVTVYVYVPVASPVIVLLVPLPVVVPPPGLIVKVHVPLDGRPLKATLPMASAQVGCVIAPTTGAVGVAGWVLIITFADDEEVHPSALVTINVYVPASKPEIVVLVPEPIVVAPPGLLVRVQVPLAGRPVSITLPVATKQVG